MREPDQTPTVDEKIPGSYIVVLRDDILEAQTVGHMAESYGLELQHTFNHALNGFSAMIPAERLNTLLADPRVAFVSEDRLVSIVAQTLPTGVNRVDADVAHTSGNTGAGVHVAVIDTGIDLKHPDLQANIVGGKNCSTGKSYADGNGHGTHVAGTIAALNNTIGVIGMAPEAKLWSVRVLNNAGSGSWSSVICGIDFVTSKAPANGGSITVANMSLGGGGSSDNDCGNTNGDALHKAICKSRDAGVTYVVAAGNSGVDAGQSVPSAYDDAVITVSALADSDGMPGGLGAATSYGADDTFATFSNYGSVVDIGAPGVKILSTWKGGGYATISGT
ncbi:MAG TPA: S8 family serine peptidase, partial [Methylophilaceae bacterium]|nr:S8 family serine peptidase [Methylophilaceae bacterium]